MSPDEESDLMRDDKHKDTKQERLICLLAAVKESIRERTLTRSLNTLIEAKAHR